MGKRKAGEAYEEWWRKRKMWKKKMWKKKERKRHSATLMAVRHTRRGPPPFVIRRLRLVIGVVVDHDGRWRGTRGSRKRTRKKTKRRWRRRRRRREPRMLPPPPPLLLLFLLLLRCGFPRTRGTRTWRGETRKRTRRTTNEPRPESHEAENGSRPTSSSPSCCPMRKRTYMDAASGPKRNVVPKKRRWAW